MTRRTLQIQAFFDNSWHQAAEVEVLNADAGMNSPTRLTYRDEYITAHLDGFGTRDARAVSDRYPLEFNVWSEPTWPAFLLDIAPVGAARRWWQKRLAPLQLTEAQLDFHLLANQTISPIGNLRISNPMPGPSVAFEKYDVCQRHVDFLEHAAEHGAAIGGATGAGGEAPKVLLVEDADGKVYPESTLPDERVKASWLVKWPRGRDTRTDRIILESEYIFAHALFKLGFDTCPGEWQMSDEGKPSLWLPRFDRISTERGLQRLAVESMYSLAGISLSGASVTHEFFLEAVTQSLVHRDQTPKIAEFVKEYVARDLLNVILGNTDNHGRNQALIRSADLQFSAIYDLAPMVMDSEGIVRSTRWGRGERLGEVNWLEVCKCTSQWVPEEEMLEHLRQVATQLLPLPDVLRDTGLPHEVFEFPRIYLKGLADHLKRWGLK